MEKYIRAVIMGSFLSGAAIAISLYALVQNEVCTEIAELMVTKKHYTLLSGCRWDMPNIVDTGDLPEPPTKGVTHD